MTETRHTPLEDLDASRRRLFKAVGAMAAIPLSALSPATAGAAPAATNTKAPWMFFNAVEAAFVEAAIARLIPDEPDSPGALAAGAATYIDRQLAGAWGHGLQLYASGPFKTGTASQGYQSPFTPAQIYRLGIQSLTKKLGDPAFDKRPPEEQDRLLDELDKGAIELEPVSAQLLFLTLWQNTTEGYFCDPAYGGNQAFAGWKLVGFPGAYAAYADWVDQHNVPFRRPPIGMGQLKPMSMPPPGSVAHHDHRGA